MPPMSEPAGTLPISPRLAAARHTLRCDEYNPSRRSNAPKAPGETTPQHRGQAQARKQETTTTCGYPRSPSYTKLRKDRCLTHVGREGSVIEAHLNLRPAGPLVLGFEWRRIATTYATGKLVNYHLNVAVGFVF